MTVKDETKELQSLISNSNKDLNSIQQLSNSELPTELEDPEPIFEWDGIQEMRISIKKARKSIEVLVNSIVPKNLIKSKYIQDKLEQDSQQLGKLICQQKSIELMQTTNMNAVGKGNVSPRMFEVFTMLSKNHSDISKQISEFQTILRKSYIDTVLDLKNKDNLENPNQMIGQNSIQNIENKSDQTSNIFVGTSELVKKLQDNKKQALKEVDFIESIDENLKTE